jgi:hypothetical protein
MEYHHQSYQALVAAAALVAGNVGPVAGPALARKLCSYQGLPL